MDNTIPLFYYPTTLAWLDDDKNLLNAMELAFNKDYHIKIFDKSTNFLDFFNTYQSPLKNYAFIYSNEKDEFYGVDEHIPACIDIKKISTIANDTARFNDITTAIIDYHLPDMTGFEVAKKMKKCTIKKLLLTGKASADDAIQGFNNDLINKMVRKGHQDTFDLLTKYIAATKLEYFCELSHPIVESLKTEVELPVNDPVFVDFFKKYCEENNIREYYIIDKQGSYLCIDSNNKRHYLVMHNDNSLKEWLAINAELSTSTEDMAAIQNKELIPFFGLGKAAWDVDSSEWKNHLYPAKQLDGKQRYYWSVC